MIHLHDIRYVRLGTRDLAGATRYATEVLGLEVARKSAGAVVVSSSMGPLARRPRRSP